MQDRHAAILGELSELSLSLARDLHQAALEAEEPAQKAALAASFHKLSRSVRQTLALEAKLHRDMQADAQRAEAGLRDAERQQQQKRKDAIQEEVSRLIWTESERYEDENNELEEDLEAILIFNDLPDLPDEEIVRQLAERLGVPCPRPKGAGDREAVKGGAAHRQSSPPGEVSAQRAEGVEGQDARRERASTPSVSPLSRRSTSPGGEDLEARGAYRDPIPIGLPIGLPGEFGPDGQTGDDRVLPPI